MARSTGTTPTVQPHPPDGVPLCEPKAGPCGAQTRPRDLAAAAASRSQLGGEAQCLPLRRRECVRGHLRRGKGLAVLGLVLWIQVSQLQKSDV